jgi:hypothetical protein
VPFRSISSFKDPIVRFSLVLGWKSTEAYSMGFGAFFEGKDEKDNPFKKVYRFYNRNIHNAQLISWSNGWKSARDVSKCFEV